MKLLIEIIGWVGSFMVIAAYGLNSYQKIKSDSMLFLLFNFMGGLLLILYTYYKETYASTFLNVVWVIIAIPAIINFFKHKAA